MLIPTLTLVSVNGQPMHVGSLSCQQEASIIQSFNCNRKYLSPFIVLVG